MRILWVKADKLLPVESGGNIRTYHILRHLASRHELTFYSYYGGKADKGYERELQQRLPGSVAVFTGKRELSGISRGLDYLAHLNSQPPYAVSRFASFEVQDQLRAWFREQRFDVAVCDFLDAAVNFPGRLNIPCVLFQHNVESEIWRRHAATAGNPLKKMMYGMEFRKMQRYEQIEVGKFVGAMDWEPNIDGVEYFASEIWPAIKAEVREARLRIVGRNPDRRVKRWASESIEVTGRVPSVVDHLRESAVVIVPLRIGGGTRLKIYEAMATAKAVVSTNVGAEGLDVHHGRDIMLADDARSFAQAVIMLLRDRELRRRYERAAAETASRCDWPAIGERFQEVLRSAVERKNGKMGAVPARTA